MSQKTQSLTLDLIGVKFTKYFAVAKINLQNAQAYLVNSISKALIVTLRIWIFTQLYRITYDSNGVTQIGGLTLALVIWNLMLAQSFQSAVRPQVSYLIEEEVKNGTLAYSINRPFSYILFQYAAYWGRLFSNLFFNLAIGLLAALILVGPIFFSFGSIFFGLILLFLGLTLDFFIYLIIGLLAFWVEDIKAFNWLYVKAQIAFGGVILPLSLFPDSIRKIAEMLPFAQLYYSAARVMVNFEWPMFYRFLLIQLFWVFLFGLLSFLIFKKCIKHATINGG